MHVFTLQSEVIVKVTPIREKCILLNKLKKSYDIAKKNIILCIWCNAMCLCGLRFKTTLFSTYCTLLLLLYAPPFWNTSIFTKLIVLRSEVCSDWPAIQCVVIGRIPQAWDGNVTPLTILWCCVLARRHKNNKTHDRKTTNNKHYSTLLKTRVWIVSGKFFKYENILTWVIVSHKHQTGLAKLELPHFIETAFAHSWHCRLLSQVQEIVLCKMRCTHSNISVGLFWNSAVNTT